MATVKQLQLRLKYAKATVKSLTKKLNAAKAKAKKLESQCKPKAKNGGAKKRDARRKPSGGTRSTGPRKIHRR